MSAADKAPIKAPIYVFDGECVLCSRAVRYVLKYDRTTPPIRFAAIKSDEGRRIAKSAGVNPDDPHTFIYVDEDGAQYLLSEAVFAMAERAGGPARFVPIFRFIPRPVRDWVYARLANNRYALFGKLDACYTPTPETRERFTL
ncbi:MAG: DCC1-like thiol-disulfide oxidoreductase family protein [Pseudomonadota bacterium]